MRLVCGLPSPGQRTVQTITLSPQTIGLACPCPFSGDFQRTFLFSAPPQVSGRSFSREYPNPVGPRNAGQLSARDNKGIKTMMSPVIKERRFAVIGHSLNDLSPFWN